jgi:hypothetical protein
MRSEVKDTRLENFISAKPNEEEQKSKEYNGPELQQGYFNRYTIIFLGG